MSLINIPQVNPSNVSDIARSIFNKPTKKDGEEQSKMKRIVHVDHYVPYIKDKDNLEQQKLNLVIEHLIDPENNSQQTD